MTNKDLAKYTLGSMIIYLIGAMVYAESEEGVVLLITLLSFICYAIFAIWGLVRLFKSND